MSKQNFAFVRSLRTSGGGNLKDFAQIKSAEAHAKREDLASQQRQVEGRSHTANYFWSKSGNGLEEGGADYAAAYRAHKKQHRVTTERKGAAIGMHLLVGVSPEWLSQDGDPRALDNKKVQELISHAKSWAESWMGEGAVWAVRYDTDETGAGVVDILASPIREQKHKSGTSKPSISVAKANAELAAKHGVKKSYEAMQTDWALYAQQHLDPTLERGTPVRKTGREHVSPETYKAIMAENEALRKELDARSAEQDAREQKIKDGRFDRLLKRDPAAAAQVEAAQEAQRGAERTTEAAEARMVAEVASAEGRASEHLSERLSRVEQRELRVSIRENRAMKEMAAARDMRASAVKAIDENKQELDEARRWKMFVSVEKNKVTQLESENSNLKVQLELIREATNEVLGRLPNWGELKSKLNKVLADRWGRHPENPNRIKPDAKSEPDWASSGVFHPF